MGRINLDEPATPAARAAFEVATAYYSPALLNHCLRSYQWGVLQAKRRGIPFDDEMLYVTAMLHDLGLVSVFDTKDVTFEKSGADLAWLFGAAAGWSLERLTHAGAVIINHMADDLLAPDDDAESYLLSIATALDISGSNLADWDESERGEVVSRYPRHGLGPEFVACFENQARRKPGSSPAGALRSGIAGRIARNPLDHA